MAPPLPQHQTLIQPYSVGVNLSDEETAIRVYGAVERYMTDETYMFHRSSKPLGKNVYYDEFSGIARDNIIIRFYAQTQVGSIRSQTERVPMDWGIDVFSLTTPIDKVKKDLVEIVKNAAKK